MDFDMITEVGQTVLQGLHDAGETIVKNMRSPVPYISGAVGILCGILIASLTSGRNRQEPME